MELPETTDYGTEEFGQRLNQHMLQNGIVPKNNLFEWSKDYYNEHINIFPTNIAYFMTMVIESNATEDSVLAGWCLSFNAILGSKEKLENHGCPRNAQIEIIHLIHDKAMNTSEAVKLQIYRYFHTHPYFAKNFDNPP